MATKQDKAASKRSFDPTSVKAGKPFKREKERLKKNAAIVMDKSMERLLKKIEEANR